MKIQDILAKTAEIADKIAGKFGGFKYIIGIFLLLVGLIFLVTPFTPGATFLIILGLQIIGVQLMKPNK